VYRDDRELFSSDGGDARVSNVRLGETVTARKNSAWMLDVSD
jgi:hypothetical protein